MGINLRRDMAIQYDMVINRGLDGDLGMAATHGMSPEELIQLIKIRGESKTLELGPGQGQFIKDLLDRGLKIRGVDVYKRKESACSDMIDEAYFDQLPYTNSAFNLILASRSLTLYATGKLDLKNQVREVNRVAAPDCELYLTTEIWIADNPSIRIKPFMNINDLTKLITQHRQELNCRSYLLDSKNGYFLSNIISMIEKNSDFKLNGSRIAEYDTFHPYPEWIVVSQKYIKHENEQ